ncbi:MAG TPA: twin-arginine translocation signal domain-containing protein [Candidatus Sulfomarinibacteraceae bacterium]|nr:twin-arginine translocation signal domain-containing protein [Candidatus Sulfomarinibacteraceae bacterium]
MVTHNDDNVDRRGFLKAVALTAAAAAATGGGAAYFMNEADKAPVVTSVNQPPPPPAVSQAETVINASHDVSEVLAQLASSEAENLRLRAELDAAQRRLSALEESNGDVGAVNETLRTELASANQQVSVLAGLVALYEQLDDINLLETVDGGLNSLGGVLSGLVDDLPRVEEGLARGQQALENFEAQIPLVQNGRQWLDGHLARLNTFYEAAETVLTAAVENAGSFLQKLNEWFQGIRKWLPFGVGDRAAEVMAVLTTLLDETPKTIEGLHRNIAEPLDVWLATDGEDVALRNRLVKPLKDGALSPSGDVVQRVRETREVYETELVEPVKVAAKTRHSLREEIAAYRKKHSV